MASTGDRRRDQGRKQTHLQLKSNKAQQRGPELSDGQRRWRAGVLVVSLVLFVAGILIVVVPVATMATMVPAPLLVFGVICLLLSLGLPMGFFCRSERVREDVENSAGSQATSRTQQELNLSVESEQPRQDGCLQTTPKIFRFSNKKHKPQRIPLTAAKPPPLAVTGRERRLTELDQPRNFLEVSTERKIEINESQSKRTDKINLGFIPDCADKKQDGNVNSSNGKTTTNKSSPENIKISGNKRFSFNIKKSSHKEKTKFSNKEKNLSEEISHVNKSFQNENVLDSESKAFHELTKEIDVDSEISGIEKTQDQQNDLNFTSANFITKKMLESFKSSSKKNCRMDHPKKGGENIPPGNTNYIQFPPEENRIGRDQNRESGTAGEQQGRCPEQRDVQPLPSSEPPSNDRKQILLKSNNFMKAKEKLDKKEQSKQVKMKTWNSSSLKKKKPLNHFNGKTPKSSTKNNKKPMRYPNQNSKENSVNTEYENETTNEAKVPNLKEKEKVEFERKGFKRKSASVDKVRVDKKKDSRISTVLKVFTMEKKNPSSGSVTENADLMMTGESVKDKYITTNYGPREVLEDAGNDSPPLVHFGNIPQDVDLVGMRITKAKETSKSKLDLQEEKEEGKFSDVLKFISKRERNEGKVTKNKKGRSSSKKSSDQPKSRSIDQINRMLLDIADNKCPPGGADTPDLPQPDQKLLEQSLFVNFNPGGLKRQGSMESFDDSSSVGSTGSYRSTNSSSSIMYPVRSSLKKSRNKDTLSAGSSHSKKSVTYAIGSEQTTV